MIEDVPISDKCMAWTRSNEIEYVCDLSYVFESMYFLCFTYKATISNPFLLRENSLLTSLPFLFFVWTNKHNKSLHKYPYDLID